MKMHSFFVARSLQNSSNIGQLKEEMSFDSHSEGGTGKGYQTRIKTDFCFQLSFEKVEIMAGIFGSKTANDQGDWTSNKEMNPAANSSVTENGLLEEDDKTGDTTWRENAEDSKSDVQSDDPGRTPGKAEGDEDFDKYGNNS